MKTVSKLLAVVAVVTLAALLAVAEGDPTQAPQANLTAAELEARADAFMRTKNYSEALESFRAAIQKDAGNAVLYNKAGIAQLQLGKTGEARKSFDRSIKLKKNYAEPLNNMGVAYYMINDYGRAVKFYKKALALNEGSASFHSNLGTAWFAQKKVEKAVSEYTRALELDPDVLMRTLQGGGITARVASPEDRAYYNYILAKMYAKRGDIDRAIVCLQKAKEEGYKKLGDVWTSDEFATVRGDQRVAQLVPPPAQK